MAPTVLVIVLSAVVGLVVGVVVYRAGMQRVREIARTQAAELRARADRARDLTLREHAARAREEAMELQRAAEAEANAYRSECELISERVRKLEARVERKQQATAEVERALDQREAAVAQRQQEVQSTRDRVVALDGDLVAGLEQLATQTRAELRAAIVEGLVDETRSHCADRLRNLEANTAAEFARQAKRIMGLTLQRYAAHWPRERGSSLIALEPGQADKLSGEDARNLEALIEISGAQLTLSDERDSLRIETADGMARELCRRAVARIVAEAKVKDPQRLVTAVQRDLQREAHQLGIQAFEELELEPAADEIVDLVGRLAWRTSYTQNQYRHSIEAGWLAGMMAEELGLDVKLARRATLLHDIGKVLTPLTEGSHALIGAEIARRCGELEAVANAVGAHHGEEPMGSPYAWLATAADAMSGGRPGARREIVESYDERIHDLEKVACSFKAVKTVHAVQAGRELRVHVDEEQIADEELQSLCTGIAERISDEVVFPGQIRVTVIREFRATAQAS